MNDFSNKKIENLKIKRTCVSWKGLAMHQKN